MSPLIQRKISQLFTVQFLLLLLKILASKNRTEKPLCFPHISPSLVRDGDLVMGAFLPMYSVEVSDVTRAEFFRQRADENCRGYK